MTIGIIPPGFDPVHIKPAYAPAGYVEVYECRDCGAIGEAVHYRSKFRPCPRCGSCAHPIALVAAWLATERRVRIRRVWWRPSTWSGYRTERTGVWVRTR